MLHRYGNYINCHMVEEYENELTNSAMKDDSIKPHSMTKSANTRPGLAFNNYYKFTDLPSEKDTLYETVGIGYELLKNIAEDNIDLNVEAALIVNATDTADTNKPI